MFEIAPSELRGQKCCPDIIGLFDRNRIANINASAVPAVLFSGAIHGDGRVVPTAHKIVILCQKVVSGTSASFSVVTAELDCMTWSQLDML
jgi:hypothetical protein